MKILKNKVVYCVGYLAAIAGLTAITPQIIKCIVTESAYDLSLWSVIINLASSNLWLIYGLLKKDRVLIISNSIGFMFCFALLLLKIRYG